MSVAVLPLSIDAPGRAIVTEKATFLLAGRTSPGAEIVAAGKSLGTTPNGVFSQTMNVSSVGSTEIEVRAKMPGRAPRLVRIGVERVTSLEAAAESFHKRNPVDYATAAKDPAAAIPAVREMGEELELFGPFEVDPATGRPIAVSPDADKPVEGRDNVSVLPEISA